ncbi:MAG: hypothetical protein DHS80DRAFT_21280 [Piptocephalis tieghemiana]|nr:MAG: hypothetical protein DHS80DRAFT_21280 [Piptocephalis tieghemiana]
MPSEKPSQTTSTTDRTSQSQTPASSSQSSLVMGGGGGTVDDQTLRKIWTLTGQLSAQLSRNQQHVEELRRKADTLEAQEAKAAMAHEAQADLHLQLLEEENARLRERNRLLDEEAHDLTRLLREHEAGLSTILDKFRSQALSVQAATMKLRREHAVQMSKEHEKLQRAEAEITMLKDIMARMTGCIRRTLMEEMAKGEGEGGQEEEEEGEEEEEERTRVALVTENAHLRQLLHIHQEMHGPPPPPS